MRIPCGVTVTALQTEAGEKLGALMILTDLTEIKKLEADKLRTDHLASIGVLAANVAHEIKNPLVAINTYFTLLPSKGNDKEFQEEFQEVAAKETSRINKIVEDMLNLSRPSQPFIRPIDPLCVVRDAISLLKNVAKEKGVEITSDLEKKNCQIMADEAQIKQVLINILHNAFDAITGKGCVNVSTHICNSLYEYKKRSKVQDGSVFYSFETPYPHNQIEKHYYVCKISDNGTGIPSTKMSSLFEPFFTTKAKGTGLGLAIIYSILKEHKGGVYVQSTEGEGTDFCVCLPLVHIGTSVSSPKTAEISST
jgi:signal transduction histidine kinase